MIKPAPIWSLHSILLVVVSSIAFLWPAMLNGGPFWFPDSSTYIRAADAAAVTLTGHRSEWSDLLVPIETKAESGLTLAVQKTPGRPHWEPARPVLNGRAEQFADAILSLERFDRVEKATELGRQ